MGSWEEAHWEPTVTSGVPRADRAGGRFRRYRPDALDGQPLAVEGALARRAAVVERDIRVLNGPQAEGLAGISRFLLRSEAIASSRIEGLAPSPQQAALAELGQVESVRGITEQARLVANNMTVVRRSTTELVAADRLTVRDVVELHRALLPSQPQHHGLRSVQNWIGGSDWNPINADFVPPAHEHVEPLMSDLVDYLNGAAHAPLVQAAVVHAQFETIHPFTDGNGRVGRALIHTVLARRGLTERAVLPISLVLATLRHGYVDGLTSYRHVEEVGTPGASSAVNSWLATFIDASEVAVEQSKLIMSQIHDLREEWVELLARYRGDGGLRPTPRADSAVSRILERLPEAPVMTAATVSRILGVSHVAANAALDELRGAGILRAKRIDRGAVAYLAQDVLDLISWAERRLASTKFDTRSSSPNRPVPAPPAG